MAKKRLPEELNDENILQPEFFRSDLEEMYKSIDDVSALITKIDDDINSKYFNDENRSLFGRGTLTFSSEQMKTLATLHSVRNVGINNAMNAKVAVGKLILSKKKESEGNNIDPVALTRELNKIILANKGQITTNEDQFEAQAKSSQSRAKSDQKLEERIKALEQEGAITYSDNEQAIRYEKQNIQFVVQKNPEPHFVAIDGDTGSVISGYPPTLLPKQELLFGAIIANGIYKCGNNAEYRSI